MKKFSVADSVFNVNLKYTRLQNKTEELFFKCLDENRDLDYFKAELEKIWGKADYSYIQEEIAEYTAVIHEKNIEGKTIVEDIPKGEYGSLFALVPAGVVLEIISKFERIKEREYKTSIESPAYKQDKKEYLSIKLDKYTNQMIPYYSKETGKILRYVQPSTYNSMIHNTNLTKAGWNTTLNDADMVGVSRFWIPYHSFSCEECLSHQNKMLTKEEVLDLVGYEEEHGGDIFHPNCKCELVFFDSSTIFNRPNYSDAELEEQYKIRQKVNSLTLKKEEVKTKMKIAEKSGLTSDYDKYNQQRNKINKSIRELKEALPTEELKKQVVAINR